MVHGIPNISIAYMLPHSGRLSLPVDSSSLVHSQLKHISGVPAPEGTAGININKLNILDALIGQLNQIRMGGISPNLTDGMEVPLLGTPHQDAGYNHITYLDALIESYRGQIEQANAARAAMPYIPSPSAAPGAVFNLTI